MIEAAMMTHDRSKRSFSSSGYVDLAHDATYRGVNDAD